MSRPPPHRARPRPPWQRPRLVALAFLLALALCLFFLARLIGFALFWANPDHRNMPAEGWMTPGFVERSWDLPPQSLAPVIGSGPQRFRHQSLDDIARALGQPTPALLDRVNRALPQLRCGPQASPDGGGDACP